MLYLCLPALSHSLPWFFFVSVPYYWMPTGLAGEPPQWTHSGNNSQSICALDRYTDLFKYCPQPLLYFSVSIIIRSLPALLTWPLKASRHGCFYCFLFITHLCIHRITPSPSNNFLMQAFISPTPLSYSYYLSVHPILRAQGWVARMPGSSDLLIFVCAPWQ